MADNTQRQQEPPRPPFYKSSTLIPYHLQVVQFHGTTIRDRSPGERARAYLVRSSLSLNNRVVNKGGISAPVVPTIDPIQTRQATTTTETGCNTSHSLLKRARPSSRPATAQSGHKHRKTSSSLSQSLQLAATKDPRLQTFAGSETKNTALPLTLHGDDFTTNSRSLATKDAPQRSRSIERVASKVKSTAKITVTRLGKVFHHKRARGKSVGRLRKCEPRLERIPIALDDSTLPRPKPTEPTLQWMRTPVAVTKAQERLYQSTRRSCSAWEVEILGTMLERAFKYGHTDFSDLRPIGRLLARCTGTLSFKLQKVWPSGCRVMQRMYSRNDGREDDMATLIPPLGAPALIARPDAAATASGSTSWFVVDIEGPPMKGKPGLRSQIKLGIADEVIGHYQVTSMAPDFRVCCVSRKQVRSTERSLRQSERQLGEGSAPTERVQSVVIRVQSVIKYDRGSVETLNDLLSMYTER